MIGNTTLVYTMWNIQLLSSLKSFFSENLKMLPTTKIGDMHLSFPDRKYKALNGCTLWIKET